MTSERAYSEAWRHTRWEDSARAKILNWYNTHPGSTADSIAKGLGRTLVPDIPELDSMPICTVQQHLNVLRAEGRLVQED